jgi:tol-pal system protein YbgF
MKCIALCSVVLVAGCGGGAQFQGRVTAVEARVRALEEAVGRLEERAARDSDLKQQNADVRLALASVDEMSTRVQAMTQDLEQRQRDVAVMLDDLTDRVMKLESAAVSGPEGPRVDESAKDAFDRAKTDLDAGRTELAAMGFRSFIDQYPGSPLAADAQFMIGETHYVKDEYHQALTEYQIFLDTYGASDKRPLGMLRAGLCLLNLGSADQGAAMLRRVVESYPGTNEAAAARERLAAVE